jgi:hypothetical protein
VLDRLVVRLLMVGLVAVVVRVLLTRLSRVRVRMAVRCRVVMVVPVTNRFLVPVAVAMGVSVGQPVVTVPKVVMVGLGAR